MNLLNKRIQPSNEEQRQEIISILKKKNREFILKETYGERPLKVVVRELPPDFDRDLIKDALENKGYTINRVVQMKNYKEKKLLPLFLVDVKRTGNYKNIFQESTISYYLAKIVPYRRRNKPTICYNCAGYFHSAKNCHMHTRCIKCNGQHPTRDCNIKEKITDPVCINCGEKGHLAAWKGCKALPQLSKTPPPRKPRATHKP
ncbi:unnamed protein product [Larinioides sclopetarius]|uniref:CCHC-type domain-containing protein n=1 Tax=Larinioides sclopetarius TaxID=280406 RepID=A0AAV2A523_9ARAC